MSHDPLDDPALPELVATAMEASATGQRPDYAEICAEHPQLIDAVRQSVEFTTELQTVATGEAPKDPFLGRRLGDRYRLDARLGAGAMGVVFKAVDTELSRPVAVKVLRQLVLGPEEAKSRFEREAEAMAAIRHQAVATVYDRGFTADGETFLVMELLEGHSLDAWLDQHRDRKADVATAVGWVADLADGLHAAHEAAVIHRDVKPSNIFIKNNGQPVLLDFGIASRKDHATITREGGALGTPAYMAPESLDAQTSATAAVDVYGLCATLYHLVTGSAPFEGTPSQVLANLARKDPVPAVRRNPALPRDLQAILDKGMARQPRARYRSARELCDDLRALLEYRPVSARPVTATQRLLRKARRSPAFLAGASVALAVLLLFGGNEWLHAREKQADAAALQAWAVLPAKCTLVTHKNRRVTDDGELRYTRNQLDKIVDLRTRPMPSLAVRAAFQLDQGDAAGCAEDMRTLASEMGTDYAHAVAERYARAPAGSSSCLDVDHKDLPKPESIDDKLLACYLALRVRDFEAADELAADEQLDDSRLAAIWRLHIRIHQVEAIESSVNRIGPALELNKLVSETEIMLGMRTSDTAHAGTFALGELGRYSECVDFYEEVAEFLPYSYTMRLNAGLCARRANRPDDALRILQGARELRPGYAKPCWSMFMTCIEVQDLEQAEQILHSTPVSDEVMNQWYRHSMAAVLATEHALIAFDAGDKSLSKQLAEKAIKAFEQALVVRDKVSNKGHLVMARVMAGKSGGSVFEGLAYEMRKRPLAWRVIDLLLTWMPGELNKNQTKQLALYLRSVSKRLSLLDEEQQRARKESAR